MNNYFHLIIPFTARLKLQYKIPDWHNQSEIPFFIFFEDTVVLVEWISSTFVELI